MGPDTWRPFPAPPLDVVDPDGQPVELEDYAGSNVVVVFYIGEACAHCVEQLVAIEGRIDELGERDTVVLAISGDSPEQNAKSLRMGELETLLLSDVGFETARAWRSYDDFEELELHSTHLVDREGNVRWARRGGEPFMDLDFLLAEIDRVNQIVPAVAAAPSEAPAGTR